ncbi:MAG: hypothetical protein NTZ26_08045 [Candidatus Aminicenantes bacterium]|nr:hypothetical protein [Candidatus Aminicenantes bacterium]
MRSPHPTVPRLVLLAAAGLAAFAALLPAQRPDQAPTRIVGTDPQLRLAWYDQFVQMKAVSKYKDLKWQFLGPTNISGRITDVAVVSPKGQIYTIYVGAASGGVWKTDNEGTTWEPVFDQGPSAAVGTLALDPSDPKTLYVGTGEANIFRSSQSGTGVYKTADGGKTWTHLGLAGTGTIARIVVHPSDRKIIYVAASGNEWTRNPDRGVYKTVDGGTTWEKVLFISDEAGAIDLRIDPQDSQTLYAATWQRTRKKWNDPRNEPTTSGSGIWKTIDAGRTWTPINAGLPEARFRGRIGLDVCLTKPNVVYAFLDNYEKAREPSEEEKADSYGLPSAGIIKGATVYRSDDKGGSWTRVSGLTPEQKSFMESHSNTYGWVFGRIRVDPNDDNTVYTMGLPFCASNDGGKTFRTVPGPGGDHHALWIDPANSSYLVKAFDQGVAVSYDKGKNWRYFQSQIPVCQFFDIAYDMAVPFKVYGSMQDHGSFRAPVDLGRGRDRIPAQAFENAPGGEGSNHAIDPGNPNLVYSAGFYGTIARAEYGLPGTASGRPSSKTLLPRAFENEPPLRGQWLAPFILSPHNSSIVYHGMQFLFRSLDRGDTWEKISPDLTAPIPSEMGDIPYHTLFALSESPLRSGLVYAGTDDGRVWVTRDGGKAWSEIGAGLPAKKWVSRLVASKYALGTVYMTQNGKRDDDMAAYVWKSTDYGKTWVSIAAGIPLGPVNVIREDPVDRNVLYVGTDGGVFVTNDAGKTWAALGAGLPFVYVHDLIVHPRDNIVVIATHGRGMWALDANPVNGKDKRSSRFWEED